MYLQLLKQKQLLEREDTRVTEQTLALNPQTRDYGLELSREEAASLAADRRRALEESGRIEFGEGILGKLILTFSRSAYLYQYNYVPVLHGLLETFFLLKNETHDRISDDKLIAFLFDCFEHRYRGSLEMFNGREVEKLRRRLCFGEKEERRDEEEEKDDE